MLPDERGSIAALVNADGSPAAINSYDEYGIPGTANEGRFQYTGQAWIPELGLYHYKARFYSPTLGRFLQVDPIGYEDQINLYAYVGNDPVNHTDPTGTSSKRDGDTAVTLGAFLGYLAESAITGDEPAARRRYEKTLRSGNPELRFDKGKSGPSGGRSGKQERLRELGSDPKLGRADRGWIRQEQNSIARGSRSSIRNPPGRDLVHEKGREAAKGYDYQHSNLQTRSLHRAQHKFDDNGRRNKERPVN